MIPIEFKEANETIFSNGVFTTPVYEDELHTICCLQLSKEEIDTISATGKLWLKFDPVRPLPRFKATVYNPFRKLKPIEVADQFANDVIVHLEDNEEIILVRFHEGQVLNVTDVFVSEKVKMIGYGPERPEYRHIIDKYNFDVNWVYILKRI